MTRWKKKYIARKMARARRGNWPMLLLVSVPARGVRFLLSGLLAGVVARLIAPWTHRRAQTEITILALFWIGFYALYSPASVGDYIIPAVTADSTRAAA